MKRKYDVNFRFFNITKEDKNKIQKLYNEISKKPYACSINIKTIILKDKLDNPKS